MSVSWIDFSLNSLNNHVKPFSLNVENNDFFFLAGETSQSKLMRALAGFLPKECNFQTSIRINGQRIKSGEIFNSVLLPDNAAKSLPPHRTIGDFALDLIPGTTQKKIEEHAGKYGIETHILRNKPCKISPPDLQRISLWLLSLKTSDAIFVEEPKNGFYDECRPFDFLQSLLRNGVTGCIIFSTHKNETVLQRASAMQFCKARLAIFCADRLVETGDVANVLAAPLHSYTKEWLKFGSRGQRRNGALWQYCQPKCKEQHNCSAKQNISHALWDYEPAGKHKVICKEFLNRN